MIFLALLSLPVLLALTRRDLRYGFGAYALAAPLSPELSLGPLTNLRFEDFAVLALLAGGGLRGPSETVPSHGSLRKAMRFWLGWSAFATILGLGQGNDAVLAATFFFKRWETALVLYMMLNHLKTRRDALSVVAAALAGAAAAATWGFVESRNVPVDTYYARSAGPEDESNIFGSVLVSNLLVALSLGLALPRSWWKWLALAGVPVAGVAILGTLSRASYVAGLAGVAVLGMTGYRRLLVVVAVLVATTGALSAVQQHLPYRVQVRLGRLTKERAVAERGSSLQTAWKRYASASPVWGRGMGCLQFRAVESAYAAELAQGGLVGLGALLWVLWVAGRGLRQTVQRATIAGDSLVRGLSLGCFAALSAALVHGFSGAVLMAIRSSETLWLWIALGLVASAEGSEG